ncbi:hypothetical protein [Prochlorococcus marinus]|uniref:hypothetical protein n=1 Tax=Prochlorococcus marinus TaxID=1219 RepID=UPI0022B3C5E0|nr:hypothetical protein [Prochlorococcus marinus]
MKYLSDLPSLISKPSSIIYHGLGAIGGGEIVAEKIIDLFKISQSNIYTHRLNILILLRHIFKKTNGRPFCLSGPRDIPIIIFAFLCIRRADVYLQVPYHLSITRNRPIHLFSVLIYLLLVNFCSKTVLVNSSNTGKYVLFKKTIVVLPILNSDLYNRSLAVTINPKSSSKKVITLSCRLELEQGSPSKDIPSILRLSNEVSKYNLDNNIQCEIIHFGFCHESIKQILLDASLGSIKFFDYDPLWLNHISNTVVFLSLYEGFGLAPFEASCRGANVFVNEAFPKELLELAPNIHRIVSKDSKISILSQLKL